MNTKKMLFLIILLIGFSYLNLSATTMFIGDPIPTGSWSQQFVTTVNYSINELHAWIISGDQTFYIPNAFRNFSRSGWYGLEISSYAQAFGPTFSSGSMNFDLKWAGAKSVPFTMHFAEAYNQTVKWYGKFVWNGSKWTQSGTAVDPSQQKIPQEPIPEPSTILLFGAALLGCGLITRIRRRKNA